MSPRTDNLTSLVARYFPTLLGLYVVVIGQVMSGIQKKIYSHKVIIKCNSSSRRPSNRLSFDQTDTVSTVGSTVQGQCRYFRCKIGILLWFAITLARRSFYDFTRHWRYWVCLSDVKTLTDASQWQLRNRTAQGPPRARNDWLFRFDDERKTS